MAQQRGIPSFFLKGPQVQQMVSRLLVTLSNVMRVMKLEPCNFGLTTKPYDEGVAASNKNIPQLANPPLRNSAYTPGPRCTYSSYTSGSTDVRYETNLVSQLPPVIDSRTLFSLQLEEI